MHLASSRDAPVWCRYCGTELRCLGAAPTTAVTGTAGQTVCRYSTVQSVQYNTVQTVCSMNKPFKISVHSDALEYADTTTASEGTLANNRGFSISESQCYFAAEAASLHCNFFF